MRQKKNYNYLLLNDKCVMKLETTYSNIPGLTNNNHFDYFNYT